MKLNNKVFAVFIDIDGTLLGKDKAALQKNLNAIQKARSQGNKVFISTGRSMAYIPEALESEKNFDGIISGAGAIINLYGQEPIKNLMPHSLTKKFCDFVIENGLPGVLEGESHLYYFDGVENPPDNWIRIDKENIDALVSKDTPIEKFTVMGQFTQGIDRLFDDECKVLRFSHYGEIIRKDSGKGGALKMTMQLLELPLEQSIAIGDSINDLDMIEAAGIGVAMGNADERIKNIADFVTDCVDDAGVSAALYKLLDIK